MATTRFSASPNKHFSISMPANYSPYPSTFERPEESQARSIFPLCFAVCACCCFVTTLIVVIFAFLLIYYSHGGIYRMLHPYDYPYYGDPYAGRSHYGHYWG